MAYEESSEMENLSLRWKSKTRRQQMFYVFKHLEVEPVSLLFMMSVQMTYLIGQNMVILKVCKNDLNYTDAICENLTHGGIDGNSVYQSNVQKETARFNVYKSVIENLVPFFFVLFLGPWSDKHGRKVPLVLSVLGTLLSQVGALINSIYMHWPKEYLFLMGSLPYSFGGGSMCLFMMLFAYISDTSSIETRTIRVAILDAFLFGGWPAGNLLGAYLYNLDYSKRFINVYSVVVSISAANFLYSLVRVRGDTHLTSNVSYLLLLLKFLSHFVSLKNYFVTLRETEKVGISKVGSTVQREVEVIHAVI